MEGFETLSQAMAVLKQEGYKEDFNLKQHCIECKALMLEVQPEDFVIDQVHRFEGDSNPSDSSVLYAISSERHGIKGLLVDAFGVYSDSLSQTMIEKLRFNR